jgi:hypothetical protein
MKRTPALIAGVALFLFLSTRIPASTTQSIPTYFDLGSQLTEEFHGTYEFKYKRLDFSRNGRNAAYIVKSSGDQSPSTDKIIVKNGYVYWVLGSSGEKWIALKTQLRTGDHWHHILRGWNQLYRVTASDVTLSLPAGQFQHCAVVEISWVAHEHDMEGPQKVVMYLAPHLGIVKREEWDNGKKWHEEVLASYKPASVQ